MARSATGTAAPRLPRELAQVECAELDDDTELDGVELHGVTFAHDEPSGVAISASRLVGVELTGRSLDRLRLVDVVFEDCELSGLTLTGARLERVELRRCRASGLVAPAMVTRSLRAVDCRLDHAFLVDATLERAVFESCDLRSAELSGAKLSGGRIEGCDLSDAQVSRVRAAGLALHGTRLDDLHGADSLKGAVIGGDQVVDLALPLLVALGITVAEPARD
jgi:uncharacterized protein YjbI with pentapeptide repeats